MQEVQIIAWVGIHVLLVAGLALWCGLRYSRRLGIAFVLLGPLVALELSSALIGIPVISLGGWQRGLLNLEELGLYLHILLSYSYWIPGLVLLAVLLLLLSPWRRPVC